MVQCKRKTTLNSYEREQGKFIGSIFTFYALINAQYQLDFLRALVTNNTNACALNPKVQCPIEKAPQEKWKTAGK